MVGIPHVHLHVCMKKNPTFPKDVAKAIHFYIKAQCYGPAIQLAKVLCASECSDVSFPFYSRNIVSMTIL